jgi:hypothetical protein
VRAVQRAVGNRAVQRLLGPAEQHVAEERTAGAIPSPGSLKESAGPRAIEFPHADRIAAVLDSPATLNSVVDPAACTEQGTPAFTEGEITHFATESPDLHVAAHEAAHQLQHSGVTRDAGLGPEGHAGAVADSVVSGRPVGGLIGDAGAPVPASRHNYTDADGSGNWKGISAGAVFTRLADTGETWTRGSQEAYATAALVTQANDILEKRKSGSPCPLTAARR